MTSHNCNQKLAVVLDPLGEDSSPTDLWLCPTDKAAAATHLHPIQIQSPTFNSIANKPQHNALILVAVTIDSVVAGFPTGKQSIPASRWAGAPESVGSTQLGRYFALLSATTAARPKCRLHLQVAECAIPFRQWMVCVVHNQELRRPKINCEWEVIGMHKMDTNMMYNNFLGTS